MKTKARQKIEKKGLQMLPLVQRASRKQATDNKDDDDKKRFTIWQPQKSKVPGIPGPQEMALASEAEIIGYGGQAGGGKSDLIIGACIRDHYRAMIFRRYYTDLKDIVNRAKEITEGYHTNFNGSDFTITLPGNRKIEFGAMAFPDDWQRFKGRAKDAMMFDEVTEFLEIQVLSVIAWVRSARPGQRKRIIFTFNPPTDEEGKWVIRFFAPWIDESHPNRALPGEIRWFAMVNGEWVERPDGQPFENKLEGGEVETIYPQSRTFIPAKLSDNVYLETDGEYRRRLQNTPEPLRSQLLYGKFNANNAVNPYQAIPTAWVKLAMARGKQRGGEEYLKSIEKTVTPILSTDVAHGGKDKTVIARQFGDFVAPLIKHKGVDTPDGISVARFTYLWYVPGASILVDANGYGASAYESLTKKPEDGGFGLANVTPINFGEGSEFRDRSGKFKALNKRAEAYWRLREALDPDHNPTLCLPDDPELLADLCAANFKIRPGGVLQVDSKEEIRTRIKRSTDCGDAVLQLMLADMGGWGKAMEYYEGLVSGSPGHDYAGQDALGRISADEMRTMQW